MKRWALLTLAMYFLILAILSLPGVLVALRGKVDLIDVYQLPLVWVWAGVMVLGQALLLFVPIGIAERRSKPRRKLMIPVITSTFFMTLLILCAGLCIVLAVWGEGSNFPFETEKQFWTATAITTLSQWGFWGGIFYYFRRSTGRNTLTNRLMQWLLGGSILELLVAVPSHIIVRQRGDCCAPFATFFGISTGIAVMLMAFGPGVFFLFVKRIERLRSTTHCRKCGYDLRASPVRCPECGTPVAHKTHTPI